MKKLSIFLLCSLLVLTPLSVSATTSTIPSTEPSLSTTVKGGVTYYTEKPLTYKIVDGEAIITDCVHDTKGELIIPDTLMGYPVTEIADEAFYDCAWLTHVTLPDSVRRIGDYAFYLCKDLQSITLSKGVEQIGRSAFTDTDALETILVAAENPHLTVDKGILYSKDKTVLYFAPIKAVAQHTYVISDGVTTIHSAAFTGNRYLRCVVMPDSVTTVGSEAFLLCSNLESVVLSSNLQAVKKSAFWNCASLKQVFYNGTDAQFAAMVIEDSNALLDFTWQTMDEATLQSLTSTTQSSTTTTAKSTTTTMVKPTSTTTTVKTQSTTTTKAVKRTTSTKGEEVTTTEKTTTAATTPSSVSDATASTSPTTVTTDADTAVEDADGTAPAPHDPRPILWIIGGVGGGLLIAASIALVIVLRRKK